MANKVAELFADFQIKFSQATLDLVNTTMGELRLGTIAEIATLGGLTQALFDVGANAVKTATNLHELGVVYGINAQGLQDMERAGLAANVSIDKIQQSAVGLQNNLAGLQLGQVSSSFLQAAGFLGLNIGPGMDKEQVMKQLFEKVPGFVKAHGKMGNSMAALLLGQLGIAPEALQYILAGKEYKPGKNISNHQIEAITTLSENTKTGLFDINNTLSNGFGHLADLLSPISNAFAGVGGLIDNLLQPVKQVEGLGAYVAGLTQQLNYQTPEEAREMAALQLYRHQHPATSPFLNNAAMDRRIAAERGASGAVTDQSKTEINVYGVEDKKIAGKIGHAVKRLHEDKKREYSMFAGITNPVQF